MAQNGTPRPLSANYLMSRSQELDYVEALKTHQTGRLEHIRSETRKQRSHLQSLRQTVAQLESQKRCQSDERWAREVLRLRHHNRALRIECHCLSMEVDLYAKGGVPLGVTDAHLYAPPTRPLQRSNATRHRPPPPQPPSYEESLTRRDLLRQVPPAPRPVWLSPPLPTPPQLPPRPTGDRPWSCGSCTVENHPFLSYCEVCEMPRHSTAT